VFRQRFARPPNHGYFCLRLKSLGRALLHASLARSTDDGADGRHARVRVATYSGDSDYNGSNATLSNDICYLRHAIYESEEEFAGLLANLQQELQPEGPSEQFWVGLIAECMWKCRRAIRAEKGAAQAEVNFETTTLGWS
jgi:hypothetical protein